MKVAVIILAIVAILAAGVAGFAIWKMDSSVTVPDVVGEKAADAVGDVTGAGLAYSVEHTYDNDVQKGEVAKQKPSPGKAAKGSMVVLWVSDGSEKVQVPDVTGQTVSEADAALTAAGLNPRQVAGSSPDVQKGQIYKMVPASGTEVPRGSIITVYYSHTSPTVPVPSLSGLTEAQAAEPAQGQGAVPRQRRARRRAARSRRARSSASRCRPRSRWPGARRSASSSRADRRSR